MLAVLSATPAIRPTAATGARSVTVRKSGSTGTIISEEMSVKKLTNAEARTLPPRTRRRAGETTDARPESGVTESVIPPLCPHYIQLRLLRRAHRQSIIGRGVDRKHAFSGAFGPVVRRHRH